MNFNSRRRIAVLVAVCFLSGLTAPASAQFGISTARPPNRPVNEPPKPKTIRGLVEDQNGKPLAGARIFVRDTKTNLTRTATTDGEGFFEVKNLAPEVTYDVTAELNGVSDKKSVSGLLTRTDNILDFQLKIAGSASNIPADPGLKIRSHDGMELAVSLDLPSGVPAPIPAVLLLHGYGENRGVFASLKTKLLARGLAVMAMDLRGYGSSAHKGGARLEPSPAWRASSHEWPPDIEPALDWLKSQPRIDSRAIGIIGHDIGANLALIASGRFKEARTVIAIKPNFTETLAMAGSAQDFHPRSALIVGAAAADEAQWKASTAAPVRTISLSINGDAEAWFENAQVFEAAIQWLKETF